MVARKEDADRPESGPTEDLFPRVFTTWRALLTRLGRDVAAFLRPTEPTRARRQALLGELSPFLAGGASVVGGPLLGVALAAASGGQGSAWFALASTLAWAFGRLLLLELALPHRLSRRRVLRPWAWGLIPYAIALTPVLTLVAWLLSAGLTGWLFTREGLHRNEAVRGVGTAWGAQALFAGIAWLIVNGWVAFLGTR